MICLIAYLYHPTIQNRRNVRGIEAVASRKCPKGFPADVFKVAYRKLAMLEAALVLDDLRSPPGSRLEALKGHRKG